MNYEAINRFTREKEKGKEKRTFGTGWKIQPVPQGPIWVKKSGALRGSRTVATEPKLPSVTIEILKNYVQTGSKNREK